MIKYNKKTLNFTYFINRILFNLKVKCLVDSGQNVSNSFKSLGLIVVLKLVTVSFQSLNISSIEVPKAKGTIVMAVGVEGLIAEFRSQDKGSKLGSSLPKYSISSHCNKWKTLINWIFRLMKFRPNTFHFLSRFSEYVRRIRHRQYVDRSGRIRRRDRSCRQGASLLRSQARRGDDKAVGTGLRSELDGTRAPGKVRSAPEEEGVRYEFLVGAR